MDQKCDVLNIVNAISLVKFRFNWAYFGEYFELQERLQGIKTSFAPDEFVVRAIELWCDTRSTDECTWENLQKGLKPVESMLESSLPYKTTHPVGHGK